MNPELAWMVAFSGLAGSLDARCRWPTFQTVRHLAIFPDIGTHSSSLLLLKPIECASEAAGSSRGSSATSESHALGRETLSWLEWVGPAGRRGEYLDVVVELHRMLALPVWSLSIFDEQARPRCKLTDERSPAA